MKFDLGGLAQTCGGAIIVVIWFYIIAWIIFEINKFLVWLILKIIDGSSKQTYSEKTVILYSWTSGVIFIEVLIFIIWMYIH